MDVFRVYWQYGGSGVWYVVRTSSYEGAPPREWLFEGEARAEIARREAFDAELRKLGGGTRPPAEHRLVKLRYEIVEAFPAATN